MRSSPYAKFDGTKCMQEFYLRIRGLRGGEKDGSLRTQRQAILKYFAESGMDPDQWLEEARAGKRDYEREWNEYLRGLSTTKLEDGTLRSDSYLRFVRTALIRFARCLKLPEPDLIPVGSAMLKRDQKPFEKTDIMQLFNAARNVRDRAILLVASNSGARESEIAGLRRGDFNEIYERKEEPYCVWINKEIAKGGRPYFAFFTQEAADVMKTFLATKEFKDGDRVFPTGKAIGNLFHNMCKRAGLKGGRWFHMLRHYARSTLAYAALQPDIIEKLIGHALGSIEQTYMDSVQEQLRGEYARALPLFHLYSRENGSTRAKVSSLEEDVERLRRENEGMKRKIEESDQLAAKVDDLTIRLQEQEDRWRELMKEPDGVLLEKYTNRQGEVITLTPKQRKALLKESGDGRIHPWQILEPVDDDAKAFMGRIKAAKSKAKGKVGR